MKIAKRLNPLDWMFLAAETVESPMHVGVLMQVKPPRKASTEFLRQIMDDMREQPVIQRPWNLKLRYPNVLAHPLQAWVEDAHFDVDYHIRRSALASPGDERELGILVSRLHSHPIDFRRPPWEVHLIEGLEGGRLALYFKVHHALVDGYSGVRLLADSLSSDPADTDTPMFFVRKARTTAGRVTDKIPNLDTLFAAAREQIGATRSITTALRQMLRRHRDRDDALVRPMQAPRCVLNGPISRSRRFATQQFEIDHLKRIARAQGGTLNDIVLALCGDALRRLLAEQNALPKKALTAMLPVNVRPKDDPGGGNAVGAILANLGTDLADPVERFRAVVASTKQAKAQLSSMSHNAILQYSALLMAPAMLSLIPGSQNRIPPAFNLVISNVPGPKKRLYFRGWELDAMYPVSIPYRGYGLNITVLGYGDTLNFGFIGDRDALPHLQRLAVYSRDALEALEAATPS